VTQRIDCGHGAAGGVVAGLRKFTGSGFPVLRAVLCSLSVIIRLPRSTSAETAVKRLAQMRTIAKDFEAADDFEGKSRWELRLLAK
jgi:hypothetical protein